MIGVSSSIQIADACFMLVSCPISVLSEGGFDFKIDFHFVCSLKCNEVVLKCLFMVIKYPCRNLFL
jgi:hypothetical protein